MDHAMQIRRDLIASSSSRQTHEVHVDATIKRLAGSLEQKRIRAINTLGRNWVFHPDYSTGDNPHHSPAFKSSRVLSDFLHPSGALAAGRV